MSRTHLNFLVDSLLLVEYSLIVFTAVVVRFVFPAAGEARGWSLWGGGIDRWVNGLFGLIALFTLTVLLHVMLHWTWVCGVITQQFSKRRGRTVRWDDGTRTLVGVGLMIVLLNVLGAAIAAAVLTVRQPTTHEASARSQTVDYRGSAGEAPGTPTGAAAEGVEDWSCAQKGHSSAGGPAA